METQHEEAQAADEPLTAQLGTDVDRCEDLPTTLIPLALERPVDPARAATVPSLFPHEAIRLPKVHEFVTVLQNLLTEGLQRRVMEDTIIESIPSRLSICQ